MVRMFALLILYNSADNSATSASRAGKVRDIFLPQEYDLAKFICDIKNPHES